MFKLGLTVMIVAGLFLNLKLSFYQEKIFHSKGVGLGKESSNKNID